MTGSPDDYGPEITGVEGGDGYGTGTGTTTAPYSTGLSPGLPLPFLFAWVDPQDDVWDYSMARVDEEILSIDLKHEEGQIPTLEIEIRNPRIGLLNPSRKQWAWLAYQPPPTAPGPAPFLQADDFSGLPYGYGSGSAPPDLTPPTVEGTPEYVVDGYVQPGYQVYDGAMVPLTPPVPATPPPLTSPSGQQSYTPSLYIPGTTIIPLFFGELLGVPTDLFAEKITLKFIARSMNYIDMKQAVAETLKIPGNYEPIFLDDKKRDDPDAILEGWSKLYHVDRTTLQVTASDVLVGEDGTTVFPESPAEQSAIYKSMKVKIGQAPLTNVQVQASVHWVQRSVNVVEGPDVTVSSYTGATFLSDWSGMHGKGLGGGWTVESVYVNDPFMVQHTPTWHISTNTQSYGSLANYDCAVVSTAEAQSGPALLGPALNGTLITYFQDGICNPYSSPPTNTPSKVELVRVYVPLWALNCTWTLRYNAKREFTEIAFLTVTANTQAILTSPTVEQDTLLIKMSGEVGEPVLIYDAWSDFAGQSVPFGQLIFPNNPTFAGGLSYQICIVPGVAGTYEPIFSDIPGATTSDGGVVWASLGENPQSKIQRMQFATQYDVGTILVYVQQNFDLNSGTLIDTETASYYIVCEPWESNSAAEVINFIPPITTSDELLFPPAAEYVTIEPVGPVPGYGGPALPGYPSLVNIGNPAWLGIPVGGTAEAVTARFFFPSARGEESLVYGINRARAKIRMRARAVDISWDCAFDMVVGMSCRQNATVYDPRLPGGVATGKVTSYGMTAKNGELRGHVTIGCPVGNNAFGRPDADISYSQAVFVPFDDGLNFPLGYLPIASTTPQVGGGLLGASGDSGLTVGAGGGVFTMTLEEQIGPINLGIGYELVAQAIENPPVPLEPVESGTGGFTVVTTGVGAAKAWAAGIDAAKLPNIMESNPRGWTLEINPVTNGPFSGAYTITTTPLELPMGINLAAASEE